MSMYGSCALCGKELFENDHIWVQVVGWWPKPNQPLMARHESGATAHENCVKDRHKKMKAGIPVKQMGLF